MPGFAYMACVKVFKKIWYGMGGWKEVVILLKEGGIDVLSKPEKADVSIVLSGTWENPGVLEGKRILMYSIGDWMEKEPEIVRKYKFELWRPVLEEYYDELISLTGMDNKTKAARIIKKINEFT